MRLLVGILVVFGIAASPAAAATILFQNDFDSPTGWSDGSGHGNSSQLINSIYGTAFDQDFSVESVKIAGNTANYLDPAGTGGAYAITMLSDAQNDKLYAAFNVGTDNYLNVAFDLSNIDLYGWGGPFVNPATGVTPIMRLQILDTPGGLSKVGTVLATGSATGVASPRYVFDWTSHVVALDASGSTNGNVTLVFDLLAGGYGAIDNLVVAGSNKAGDVGAPIPEPSTVALFGLGLTGLVAVRRRRVTRRS